MAAPIRAFMAIEPPAHVQIELADVLNRDELRLVRLRPVSSDNIHLTVRFLGPTPEDLIGTLRAEMDSIGSETPPTSLTITRVAGFPGRRPTVVAADLRPNRTLEELATRVEAMVTRLGFEPEGRSFSPHITIARTARNAGTAPHIDIPIDLAFTATELVLFRSDLSSDGPRYTRIHTSEFGGRDGVG